MLRAGNYTKVIQVGNSSGLRLTKRDKEALNLKNGDRLIKTISDNGNEITFKKPKKINNDTRKMINKIFSEDHDGIKALKKL